MTSTTVNLMHVRLAARLAKLSASAWVREVDRLARCERVSIDEALTLLGRRFQGDYLESRRHLIWPMLEYLHIRLDPVAWASPLRHGPNVRKPDRGAAA